MSIHWTSLAKRYLNEEQCLASFIAWQAAEVISNAKPANLINIRDHELACGRNIYALWNKHKQTIFATSEIRAAVLKQKGGRLLVLIYHPVALSKALQENIVKRTLRNLGYLYDNLDKTLAHLETRMQEDEFPHEIGFFLGYPSKDVLGFMGMNNLPLVGSGPWKMYGELEESLSTLKDHLAARESVLEVLTSDLNPLLLIQKKRPVIQQAA